MKYEVTYCIYSKEIYQFICVKYISFGLTHLTVALQKPWMSEYLLWKRQIKSHKHDWPVDGMETKNILSNKIDEMSATINGINPENLQRVLELLQNAQLVQIAAVGNTIPVAMDAAFKFNQLGMRCITSEISEKNSAFALTLTPQDVLLLISNSGKSRRLNQMAQTARDNGVPVVLITCDRSSPLAQLADHLLISTNREQLITTTDFALSRISAIVIIEVLYNFLLVGRPGAKGFVSRHEGLMAHDKDVR